MYIKVLPKGDQWFREDGTLVGDIVFTYYNMYYGGKTPIIKTINGFFVKPIYGRIHQKTNKLIPLCEGTNLGLCAGSFCRAAMEDINVCPRYMQDSSDGYYIVSD